MAAEGGVAMERSMPRASSPDRRELPYKGYTSGIPRKEDPIPARPRGMSPAFDNQLGTNAVKRLEKLRIKAQVKEGSKLPADLPRARSATPMTGTGGGGGCASPAPRTRSVTPEVPLGLMKSRPASRLGSAGHDKENRTMRLEGLPPLGGGGKGPGGGEQGGAKAAVSGMGRPHVPRPTTRARTRASSQGGGLLAPSPEVSAHFDWGAEAAGGGARRARRGLGGELREWHSTGDIAKYWEEVKQRKFDERAKRHHQAVKDYEWVAKRRALQERRHRERRTVERMEAEAARQRAIFLMKLGLKTFRKCVEEARAEKARQAKIAAARARGVAAKGAIAHRQSLQSMATQPGTPGDIKHSSSSQSLFS